MVPELSVDLTVTAGTPKSLAENPGKASRGVKTVESSV
jgi:hypothetical protein